MDTHIMYRKDMRVQIGFQLIKSLIKSVGQSLAALLASFQVHVVSSVCVYKITSSFCYQSKNSHKILKGIITSMRKQTKTINFPLIEPLQLLKNSWVVVSCLLILGLNSWINTRIIRKLPEGIEDNIQVSTTINFF